MANRFVFLNVHSDDSPGCDDAQAGFQIDASSMTLSANEVTTERASANHSAALKYQFVNPSE